MGYDTLSIVNMNSARRGLFSLPTAQRGSYMDRLLNNIHPDIGVLPGDNPELKNGVVRGYGQYFSHSNQDTMLLYEANKVTMTRQMQISDNIFNDLILLDQAQLVFPEVNVSSLPPTKEVVKTFSMITFHHSLFPENDTSGQARERVMEQLTVFSQRLALVTRNPILIAGDISLSFSSVQAIINEVNQRTNSQYLKDQQGFLKAFTGVDYTRSMLRGSTSVDRNVFKLEPIACKRKDPIVKEWVPQADCFIASKALELTEPKGIAIEEAMGQQIKLKALKESCVTKSEMQIPVRPPRHHGG